MPFAFSYGALSSCDGDVDGVSPALLLSEVLPGFLYGQTQAIVPPSPKLKFRYYLTLCVEC